MADSIKEQSLLGFKWNTIGNFSPYAVRFVIGLVIARLLEPDDFGVIGMLSIFMSISQSFVNSGFSNALIRKIDRTEVDCSTAFHFNIAVAVLFYVILFISAPYVAAFYNMPILTEVTRVLSLTIVINSMGIVPRALRSIAIDFKSQAYSSVISAVVSGAIGLYLAYTGHGVWALVWQAIVSSIVSVAVLWLIARWKPLWLFSWQSFKSMFSYGSKLMVSGLMNTVYSHTSSLIIGKFYTPAELGYYGRGQQIASMPSLQLSSVLHGVTFPILAKLQDDNPRLINVYQKYLALSSLVFFFLMTLLAVIAKPLILVLLTEKWVDVVPFLQVFCLAYMFDTVCKLNNNIIYVKGWSGLFLKLEIIKKIIVTPFLIMAIPFGVMALCFVPVVHTFVDITCAIFYFKKLLGVELRSYIVLAKYFLLSVLACTPTFLLCNINVSPWLALSVGVVMATFLYGCFLHRDVYMKECVQALLNMLKVKR